MKTKILIASVLLTASMAVQGEDVTMVQASSYNKVAELPLQNNPKLVIGATELLFTDGTSSTQFSADERVVLRVKNDEEETRIAAPKHHAASTGEAIFSTDGKRLSQLQRGVNIVRGSDGSVKKVLVK